VTIAGVEEPVLDADEIQGNIVPGFNSRFQCLIGVRIAGGADVDSAREWLKEQCVCTLREVADARDRRRRAHQHGEDPHGPHGDSAIRLNLALSFGGLRLMVGDEAGLVADEWFRRGMWEVAGSLGDHTPGVEAWKTGGSKDDTPHVLGILASDDRDRLDAQCSELVKSAGQARLEVCYEESAERIPIDPADHRKGFREHFGFRDGISVPAVRGTLSDDPEDFLYRRYIPPDDPLAARYAKPGQVLLWPGQAVFGYPAQCSYDLVAPGELAIGGPAWMRNGSFLVFRRLRQDVDAFNAFLAERVGKLRAKRGFGGVDEEQLAAMLVGRWKNGTPLTRSPGHHERYDPLSDNHFAYAAEMPAVRVQSGRRVETVAGAPADLEGLRCPQFAHIRKVNPRDAPTDLGGEARTLALQIFRRGIPYSNGDTDRGLLFLAYTTAIKERFGRLNSVWMNRPDGPEHGLPGFDLVSGQNETGKRRFGHLRDSRSREAEVATDRSWVTTTGGGFFFSPSVSLLAHGLAI
jgi:Dyp-type peroxidase family